MARGIVIIGVIKAPVNNNSPTFREPFDSEKGTERFLGAILDYCWGRRGDFATSAPLPCDGLLDCSMFDD